MYTHIYIFFIYICIFTCLIVNTQWRENIYYLSIYIFFFNLSILSGSWSPTDRWPWCFVPFWHFSCFTGVVWVGWVGWVGGGVAITYSQCALRGHARTWVLFYTQWRRANVSDTRENKIVSAEPNWRKGFAADRGSLEMDSRVLGDLVLPLIVWYMFSIIYFFIYLIYQGRWHWYILVKMIPKKRSSWVSVPWMFQYTVNSYPPFGNHAKMGIDN